MNIMNWLAYVIWCVLLTEDPTNGTWLNFVPLAAKKINAFSSQKGRQTVVCVVQSGRTVPTKSLNSCIKQLKTSPSVTTT